MVLEKLAENGSVESFFDAIDAETRIRFAAPTTFQGAWFSGLADATVTFKLYSGANLVATSATLDPTSTSTFLSSGYNGLVDSVVISSSVVASTLSFCQTVVWPGPSARTSEASP